MSWTDDRVATLKQCWLDGLSAARIALRLGDVTRNAVIGKVHRLKLPARPRRARCQPANPARAPGGKQHDKPRYPSAARDRPRLASAGAWPGERKRGRPKVPKALPPLEAAPEARLGVGDLTPTACCWPLGDPKRPEFQFCGRRRSAGTSYCAHHQAQAVRR
jgi:GcrA cell cycle regulator